MIKDLKRESDEDLWELWGSYIAMAVRVKHELDNRQRLQLKRRKQHQKWPTNPGPGPGRPMEYP